MAAAEILERIKQMAPDLCTRYCLSSLAVFGSVARGEQRPDSDVDILATFVGGPDLRRFMGLKLYLESTLGMRVDLATPDDLKDFARASAERDAIRVA